MKALVEEIEHSMKYLTTKDGVKPYFISFTITDSTSASVTGALGSVHRSAESRERSLDVDLRVGDYALDSSHQIRGRADAGRFGRSSGASGSAPLDNDPIAVKHALWLATDRAFKSAVDRFERVKTDLKTTVEEENQAHDFSREEPAVYSEGDAKLTLDRDAWAQRVRNVSRLALKYPTNTR